MNGMRNLVDITTEPERPLRRPRGLPVTLLAQPGLPHQAFWTFDNGFDDNSKRVMEVHDSSRTADEKRLLHAKNAQLHVLLDRYIEFDQ
ncbi:MAG: hypothetical protein IPH00_05580 [Flavobacteriales bacterium]|nr:hypothetical protein [Flavobacteriales bacterium]